MTATVGRKQLDLPRFAVVPAGLLQPWRLDGTTMVEVGINGIPVSRRTMKRWDDERWFVSITAQDCKAAGIDTGDRIELTLSRAAIDLPVELSALIAANARPLWPGKRCLRRDSATCGSSSHRRSSQQPARGARESGCSGVRDRPAPVSRLGEKVSA